MKNPIKRKTIIRITLILIIDAILALLLILPLRGIMNAVSRIDYIFQRLDDYPRMKAVYLKEEQEWQDWWLKDYDQRAQQAAYMYTADEKYSSDAQKLAYIAKTLNAEKAQIVSQGDYQAVSDQDGAEGMITSFAELGDGRVIVLDFPLSSISERTAAAEEDLAFLSQLQAGLPGHICIITDEKMSVYPASEDAEAIRDMVSSMLEKGSLDPAGLAQQARQEGKKTARKEILSAGTDKDPGREYLLTCTAYSDNDDLVINISDVRTLFRFGRKRSWGLWFLSCAIMALLGVCLWKTRLYKPGAAPEKEFADAVYRSVSVMFVAALLILGSVLVIQMLSSVNLAQQGATDQAEYLKKVLDKESERADQIEQAFDDLYLSRAKTAAAFLRDNPQHADADSLHELDHSLGGVGLRVFSTDGETIASDELLHNAVDESMTNMSDSTSSLKQNGKTQQAAEDGEESAIRYYRAAMVNDKGRTTGWVELCAEQRQLDELLMDTGLKEVIGDLHIMDTLHVVAVNKEPEGKIAASTWSTWVGDTAEKHEIHTELLFDGYEGIVNFDGNKCYSVAFEYGDNYVIVGSENETALVFIGGVLVLTLLLSILTMAGAYRPMVKQILEYQRQEYASDPEGEECAARSEYPELGEYFRDFMIAVFLLFTALFITTQGDTASLTYSIVRGVWVRGINAATITTCIMLMSVVFAIRFFVNIILSRLGKYMSPKAKTLWRLFDSAFAYVGTIVLIIYALSLFGVDTTTLVGGVGITALIFTLGANSLIADVLAGIFIIFEGDFIVGDIIVIDNFRGVVTDIGIRTTELRDEVTRDVKIINNNTIKILINKSREISTVVVDIPISEPVGIDEGEKLLLDVVNKLPSMYPEIIGTPKYWGVSKLPDMVASTGKLDCARARVSFDCREIDKEELTYKIYRSLIRVIEALNSNGQQKAP